MKVLFICRGVAGRGGMKEYVAGIASGLAEAGHEVVIVSGGSAPGDDRSSHPLSGRVRVLAHPNKRRVFGQVALHRGLWKSIRAGSRWADVVYIHQPFFIGTWMALLTRRGLIGTLYLHPEHISGRHALLRRVCLRILLRRLDLVVAVSDAELTLIRSVGRPRRSAVVWPALESRPVPCLVGSGRPLVLSVGRLDHNKGLPKVLSAFGMLPDDIDVAVIGAGPLFREAQHYCDGLRAARKGMILGDLSDSELSRMLCQATVFLSASCEESFGIALLKAIAHGCRPVVSEIPSHREILETLGISGTLFGLDVSPQTLAALTEEAVARGRLEPTVLDRIPCWSDSAMVLESAMCSLVTGSRQWRTF